MSDNWRITKDPDGEGWTVIDPDWSNERSRLEIDGGGTPPFNCSIGYHDWRWYPGFHMDRYWYCEGCDKKDHNRAPPLKKKP